MKRTSPLRYNKSQRRGIFFLMGVVALSYVLPLAVKFFLNGFYSADKKELTSFKENTKEHHQNTVPFNPNYLTDYRAYILGLSVEEIDKLQAYRNADKYINSVEEFQRVAGISDSVLTFLTPYLKLPTHKIKSKQHKPFSANHKVVKKDINKATAEELKTVYGIGDALAHRIIKYRKRLGGFYFKDQLNEVYGLKTNVVQNLFKQFNIIEMPVFTPIDINKASIKELSSLPYFNRKMAEEIVRYRTAHLKIDSIFELRKIEGFPSDKLNRIQLYLTTN